MRSDDNHDPAKALSVIIILLGGICIFDPVDGTTIRFCTAYLHEHQQSFAPLSDTAEEISYAFHALAGDSHAY